MIKRWLLVAMVTIGISLPVEAEMSQPMTTEKAALDRATDAFEMNHMSSLLPECLSFVAEDDKSASFFYIEAHEIHNGPCGGDRSVAPLIITLRVEKKDGSVSFYDVLSDRYYPADRYQAHQATEWGD